MDEEEKLSWLSFSAFPGIGPVRFRLLVSYFGSAAAAWTATPEQLAAVGIHEKLRASFVTFRKRFSPDAYAKTLARESIAFLPSVHPSYPSQLREIPDAPIVLYVRGVLPAAPMVGIVGTRKMTGYGKDMAGRLAQGLSAAGVTVVSGLAYGIDTVAHSTVVQNGGKTVGVLGCGVDVIHPRSNTTLYWRMIKSSGAVVSEYPLGQYAAKGLFPARNRIISGLSLGVVVVEGTATSGALITARYAAEQGRDVFAVPGPATSSMSEATTILLRQGAKIATCAEDILDELRLPHMSPVSPQPEHKSVTGAEALICALLARESLCFDELVRKSNLTAAAVGRILTLLEMNGKIKNLGNNVYRMN